MEIMEDKKPGKFGDQMGGNRRDCVPKKQHNRGNQTHLNESMKVVVQIMTETKVFDVGQE